MATQIFTKLTPYACSTCLLAGVYYSSFSLYDESISDSNWVFWYRLIQASIVIHLMTLSALVKNVTNTLVIVSYIGSALAFYGTTTLVVYNSYFAEMTNEPHFEIIKDIYYNSISTLITYYVLYDMKSNVQGIIKSL